jgi:hypothetical protein
MFNLDFPGTYQRYKSGTVKAVTWLFENAIKGGYQLVNARNSQEKPKSTKKGSKKATKQPLATTYDIGTWEIPYLAQAVANSTPRNRNSNVVAYHLGAGCVGQESGRRFIFSA